MIRNWFRRHPLLNYSALAFSIAWGGIGIVCAATDFDLARSRSGQAGVPASTAPSILNKSYTITAEVEIPTGGAEGMIVTEGGRFGGYGLFLSKGVAGIRSGKPVFLYNLLNLKRTIWSGPELGRNGQCLDSVVRV